MSNFNTHHNFLNFSDASLNHVNRIVWNAFDVIIGIIVIQCRLPSPAPVPMQPPIRIEDDGSFAKPNDGKYVYVVPCLFMQHSY